MVISEPYLVLTAVDSWDWVEADTPDEGYERLCSLGRDIPDRNEIVEIWMRPETEAEKATDLATGRPRYYDEIWYPADDDAPGALKGYRLDA